MSATNQQFAAAWEDYMAAAAKAMLPGDAERGRAMLAALEANGCIPKPQGLNLLQEVTLRLMCAGMTGNVENAAIAARAILAMGEPQ